MAEDSIEERQARNERLLVEAAQMEDELDAETIATEKAEAKEWARKMAAEFVDILREFQTSRANEAASTLFCEIDFLNHYNAFLSPKNGETRVEDWNSTFARFSPALRAAFTGYCNGYRVSMDEVQNALVRDMYGTEIGYRLMSMGFDEKQMSSVQMTLLSLVLGMASEYPAFDAAHPVCESAVSVPTCAPARIDVWNVLSSLAGLCDEAQAVLEPLRGRVGMGGTASDSDAGLLLCVSTLHPAARDAFDTFVRVRDANYDPLYTAFISDVYGSADAYYAAMRGIGTVDKRQVKVVHDAIVHTVRAAACRYYEQTRLI